MLIVQSGLPENRFLEILFNTFLDQKNNRKNKDSDKYSSFVRQPEQTITGTANTAVRINSF